MSDNPTVACYLPTFLAPEMLHVYRQITGLETYRPHILTQKRSESARFPFPDEQLTVLPRPPALVREFRRFWQRRIAPSPKMLSTAETKTCHHALVESRASVLHIYFGNAGIQLLPLLRMRPRPCPMIVSFHGADAGVDLEKPAWRDAMSAVFAEADAILARSESLASELRNLGCPPDKITIQRTGIPLNDWPNTVRNHPSDGQWKLVQAGRLIEKKGYDLTLRALATARQRFPNATLEILGEGSLRDDLSTLATELGISEAVKFRGFLDQAALRKTYENAHVFLHPSRTGKNGDQEGVPNSMLEAMATGLPIVATNHGGIPEAAPPDWLVPENDYQALATKLTNLLSSETEWLARSKSARQLIEERFEQKQQIAVLEEVYHSVR